MNKCGVIDVETYLSNQYVEPWQNYDNILEAAEIINNGINNNEIFYLLMDEDSDGVGSCAIQYMYLKRCNPTLPIKVLIHDKNRKSHGLNDDEILDKLIHSASGIEGINSFTGILWVADAMTNDAEECTLLSKYGYTIIGTDHHVKDIENPNAIIVNNQCSEKVINKQLSGCGVTFKLCQAIDNLRGTRFANELLSYVHLTNISDSCEFTNPEQQTFRYWGLKYLHPYLLPFITAFNYKEGLTNNDFSFGVISRINAVIRVGTLEEKQKLFLALATGQNIEEAIKICKQCKTNQDKFRDELLENNITLELDSNIVVYKIDRKTPLTGLIAGKLMSEHNKPIFLVHEKENGEVAGSVRSPMDLKTICLESNLFNYARGHECSFGVSWQKENEQVMYDWIASLTLSEPHTAVLQSYTTKSIPKRLFDEFGANKSLYGHGMNDPLVYIHDITFKGSDIKVIGKDKRTLKLTVDGIDFMWFKVSNETKELLGVGSKSPIKHKLQLVGTMGLNVWNGNVGHQIIVNKFEVVPVTQIDLENFI